MNNEPAAGLRPAATAMIYATALCSVEASNIQIVIYNPWMTQRHPIVSNRILMITLNTANKYPFFRNEIYAREAALQFYRVQSIISYSLYGFVVMSNHIHALLNVPSPKSASDVLRLYKMGLTFQLGIGLLWQKRFYITVASDPSVQLHYIHHNPVKAGLVDETQQYPWSSANETWEISPLP